jgi:hypothetical protein
MHRRAGARDDRDAVRFPESGRHGGIAIAADDDFRARPDACDEFAQTAPIVVGAASGKEDAGMGDVVWQHRKKREERFIGDQLEIRSGQLSFAEPGLFAVAPREMNPFGFRAATFHAKDSLCTLHPASIVKQRRRLKLRVNRLRLLRLFSWLGVLAWAVTIFWLSSLSGDEIKKLHFDIYDKAEHFAAFAAGSMLLMNALALTTRWSRTQIIVVAILGIALFGATDEWHQLSTPNRSGADLYDWIADLFGAIFGAFAALFIHVRYYAKSCRVAAGDR